MLNQEKLLVALNALNSPPEPLTLDSVTFMPPVPYIGADPCNTKISVVAKPAKGYSSTLDFYYHRISLTEMGKLEFSSMQPYTVDNLLLILNNMNAAPLDKTAELALTDLEAIKLPQFAAIGDAQTLAIKAHSDSIGWVGETEMLLAFNLPDVSRLEILYNEILPAIFPAASS